MMMGISEVLNMEFCDKLVRSASLTIGHNVLLTDDCGVILASADNTRLGSLHEASISVLKSGKMKYHGHSEAQRLSGTFPGVTIPILMGTQVVGTIGITGAPEEISRYALLIQQLAQLFLSFQQQRQSTSEQERQRQRLLGEIISYNRLTSDPETVSSSAYALGINLNLPRAVVVLRFDPAKRTLTDELILARLERAFPSPQDLVCPHGEGFFILIPALSAQSDLSMEDALEKRLLELETAFSTDHQPVKIGIGEPAKSVEELHTSYENAQFALRVLEHRSLRPSHCLAHREALLERLAVSLPESVCQAARRSRFQPIWDAKKRAEIDQLIEAWVLLRFNFTLTAQALHIHKSTLVYRFQMFHTLYGLDLYDPDSVLALYLLLLRERLS